MTTYNKIKTPNCYHCGQKMEDLGIALEPGGQNFFCGNPECRQKPYRCSVCGTVLKDGNCPDTGCYEHKVDHVLVFCKNCKYIKVINDFEKQYFCEHPNNIRTKRENTFYTSDFTEVNKHKPQDLNKDNNCPWYTE